VNVNGETANAVPMEEFVEIELSQSLRFLIVAMHDRSAGNVAAANREELRAHRAYQEALHLFWVLRHHICRTAARRLAIRIRKTERELTRFPRPLQCGPATHHQRNGQLWPGR